MKEKKMFGKGEKRLDCRVFLSFCMGDAFSTNGQWLHWIVLERERERRKNKTGMRREEEKYDGEKEEGGKIARGGRKRLLSSESRWIVSIHRRLAVLSTVESSL